MLLNLGRNHPICPYPGPLPKRKESALSLPASIGEGYNPDGLQERGMRAIHPFIQQRLYRLNQAIATGNRRSCVNELE